MVNLSGQRLYVRCRDDEVRVVCKLTKFTAWRQHIEITRIDHVSCNCGFLHDSGEDWCDGDVPEVGMLFGWLLV